MAANLDTLPMETLLHIAEMSTWGVSPSSDKAHPATYARNHASLARTCRWLYEALNGELYKRNLKKDPVTESCLLWAVNVGSLGTVKRAVAYGASLNLQIEVQEETAYCPPWGRLFFPDGPSWQPDIPCSFSLLHLAVGRQHVKIVQYLLEQKVDVHAPCLGFCCNWRSRSEHFYPLHFCVCRVVRRRFSKMKLPPLEGANLSADNDSALDIVELLVSNGAFLVAEGMSAIRKLSSQGRNDLVNRLLSHSDPVSLRQNLRFAVSKNDVLLVTDLIRRGADITGTYRRGNTPLHLAAKSCKGDLSLIKLLLRQSRVNATVENERNQTPLHLACVNGNPELVRVILQQPGVSATHTDYIGKTSLHYACRSKHPDILHTIRFLIDMNVPVGQKCDNGETPLNLALLHNNFDIASMLIAEGCDPAGWVSDVDDEYHAFDKLADMTPSSQTEFVQRVVDLGVDVNIPCAFLSSRLSIYAVAPPVFIAASTLNADCMKVFLQGGTRLNSIIINSQTTFLAGLFCCLFGKPRYRPLVTKNLDKAEEVIVCALEFGATLDRVPLPDSRFVSALEYGILAAEDGDRALLELLLKHSTAKNTEDGFVTRLIPNLDNDSIRDMLLDFKARLTLSSINEEQQG